MAKLNKSTVFVAGLVALALAPPSRAETVQITASRDNTIFEEGALSNGVGSYVFAGNTGGANARRALVAFDVGAAVPSGSIIQAVTLTMRMSKTLAGSQPVGVHLLRANWGEGASNAAGEEGGGAPAALGDATWTATFFGSASWAAAGGDFVSTPSSSTMVGGTGGYTWGPTSEMVADVQQWLDAPESNFGWLLRGDESVAATAKRFGSRENAVPQDRPNLSIEFVPPLTATPTSTATSTPDVGTPTETPSVAPTSSPRTTPTATATLGAGPCPGDCNGDGRVTVDELVTAVNIALGSREASDCRAADRNDGGDVTIDELIAAVNASLTGCP